MAQKKRTGWWLALYHPQWVTRIGLSELGLLGSLFQLNSWDGFCWRPSFSPNWILGMPGTWSLPSFIILDGWKIPLLDASTPKNHAFTSFFLVKYGEIKSWWMVQPNKTPLFLLLNSTVHPDRPRSRSSQEPLRLWPSKSCEILGVSGEKPGLTWTNPT